AEVPPTEDVEPARPPFPEDVWVDPITDQSILPLPGVQIGESAADEEQRPRRKWGRKTSPEEQGPVEETGSAQAPNVLPGQVPLPPAEEDAPDPEPDRDLEVATGSVVEPFLGGDEVVLEAPPKATAPPDQPPTRKSFRRPAKKDPPPALRPEPVVQAPPAPRPEPVVPAPPAPRPEPV